MLNKHQINGLAYSIYSIYTHHHFWAVMSILAQTHRKMIWLFLGFNLRLFLHVNELNMNAIHIKRGCYMGGSYVTVYRLKKNSVFWLTTSYESHDS